LASTADNNSAAQPSSPQRAFMSLLTAVTTERNATRVLHAGEESAASSAERFHKPVLVFGFLSTHSSRHIPSGVAMFRHPRHSSWGLQVRTLFRKILPDLRSH